MTLPPPGVFDLHSMIMGLETAYLQCTILFLGHGLCDNQISLTSIEIGELGVEGYRGFLLPAMGPVACDRSQL